MAEESPTEDIGTGVVLTSSPAADRELDDGPTEVYDSDVMDIDQPEKVLFGDEMEDDLQSDGGASGPTSEAVESNRDMEVTTNGVVDHKQEGDVEEVDCGVVDRLEDTEGGAAGGPRGGHRDDAGGGGLGGSLALMDPDDGRDDGKCGGRGGGSKMDDVMVPPATGGVVPTEAGSKSDDGGGGERTGEGRTEGPVSVGDGDKVDNVVVPPRVSGGGPVEDGPTKDDGGREPKGSDIAGGLDTGGGKSDGIPDHDEEDEVIRRRPRAKRKSKLLIPSEDEDDDELEAEPGRYNVHPREDIEDSFDDDTLSLSDDSGDTIDIDALEPWEEDDDVEYVRSGPIFQPQISNFPVNPLDLQTLSPDLSSLLRDAV